MNSPNDFLSKDEINHRFIAAIHTLINKGIVSNKATIADALCVKPAKFSEILNGRMKAGADMLAILCNFYEISPDWLLMSRGSLFRTSEYPPIIIIDDFNNENPRQSAPETASTQSPLVSSKPSEKGETAEILLNILKDKDSTIGNLREEIGRLKARIEELERERPVPITPKYAHSTLKETVET